MKNDSDKAAQIQLINSKILGIAEYIQSSICSKVFSVMGHGNDNPGSNAYVS